MPFTGTNTVASQLRSAGRLHILHCNQRLQFKGIPGKGMPAGEWGKTEAGFDLPLKNKNMSWLSGC